MIHSCYTGKRKNRERKCVIIAFGGEAFHPPRRCLNKEKSIEEKGGVPLPHRWMRCFPL